MDQIKERSLEETPVWAVSVVCFALILLSMLIEAALHLLTKFLKTRKKNSLKQALGKIKLELMVMGFISLLLTIGEDLIVKICVSQATDNSFLPCEKPRSNKTSISAADQVTRSSAMLPIGSEDLPYCEAKGMVPLISSKGIKQLHIFIFVLTVFHVLYCVLTMTLGIAKMRKWKSWEEETRTLEYEIANDPRRFRLTRQTSFGRRHLNFWSGHPLLLWPVCFLRQFFVSVTKADYFTLRNGFIVAHFAERTNFDFQKFLARAFDDDFVQVVGISFWIWIFSILFIFFSAQGFYSYFWLPFIPLLMVLAVGTKLQVVITKMCLESRSETVVVHGTMLVKPSDSLFWFSRPRWLLHLIHFILFQNSFQLAFFTWTWYEYGLRSCFHRTTVDISLRIVMGVIVQFLCGYVTLPLYALVTQMGSGMKEAVFTERVAKGLKHWHSLSRQNLSRNRSSLRRQSSETISENNGKSLKQWQSLADHILSRNKSTSSVRSADPLVTHTSDCSFSDVEELRSPEKDQSPALLLTNSAPAESSELVQGNGIINGMYDGEISFATYADNDQVPTSHIVNLGTTEIVEEVVAQKIITRGAHDGGISFRTSEDRDQPPLLSLKNYAATRISDEATENKFNFRGNYDGEEVKKIPEQKLQDKIITGETHDGDISFRTRADQDQTPVLSFMNSATTEITEEVAQHKINTREKYGDEIIFGMLTEDDQSTPVSIRGSGTATITEGLVQKNIITTRIYDGEMSSTATCKNLEFEEAAGGIEVVVDETNSDESKSEKSPMMLHCTFCINT